MLDFPTEFMWVAVTSSYQIEGTWNEDGKGESIWDRFSHTPGRIKNSDTGDVACDHYRRSAEDVALMEMLGLQAYRFSVSWSRVLPAGRGAVNPAGLGHRLLLSHDRGWYDPSQAGGGEPRPFTYINEVFLPQLRALELSEGTIHQLTSINPFDAFAR